MDFQTLEGMAGKEPDLCVSALLTFYGQVFGEI